MTTPPDGGPAFPWEQSPGNQDNLGLTKRDWFAGEALKGLLSRLTDSSLILQDLQGNLTKVPDLIVDSAYAYADAMLKRRQR